MAQTPPDPKTRASLNDGLDMNDARHVNRAAQRWLRYTGLGFQMLAAIAIGAGLGWWWDQRRADGKPWGILTGSLLGCALAIGSAVRLILKDK